MIYFNFPNLSVMRKLKVSEMNRLTVEEFKQQPKLPLVIVLDNVRSLHNVGSVFRTADAFRVEEIYLCGITRVPPHPELHKTALGAEDAVNWRYFQDTHQAIDDLKTKGYSVFSIEQAEGSTLLQNLQLPKNSKFAVVLGNEVKGVQQTVIDMCDGCVEIPQFGTKHSLNVSVTCGIIVWEFFKKMILSL
jgi:tRNA G18 (ribose-2'-O)-methylase SpoU